MFNTLPQIKLKDVEKVFLEWKTRQYNLEHKGIPASLEDRKSTEKDKNRQFRKEETQMLNT